MARVKPLTPAEARLLEALACYRLLTAAQAERLGIANITHARERLRSLHTAGLVHVTERGRLAGPNVYVLSNRGATALSEWSEGRIKPQGRKEPMRATEHLNQRVSIVDVHIGLREWAENIDAVVNWVRVEFESNPNASMIPVTSATHDGLRYDPDMIASITTQDGITWLFAVEVETGGVGGRLGNFKGLLEPRLTAMRSNVLEHALEWPQDGQHRRARLLFVFRDAEMMKRAVETVERFSHDELEKQFPRVFLASLPMDLDRCWQKGGFAPLLISFKN